MWVGVISAVKKKIYLSCSDLRREAGDVWCLPPVWNLGVVIWFHFAIFSLVLLPSPVTLSVLSFSACWPFLLNFFQKILQHFLREETGFFLLYGSCFAARRSKLVGGMCSMPACSHMALVFAVICLIFYCVCPFLFYAVFKSGIDKSTEWSTISVCPNLMCFFNRGDTEGTNSLKILCRMFVLFCFM